MKSMINMKKVVAFCGMLAGIWLCFPAAGIAFEQVGPELEEFPYIDERGSIGLGLMHAYLSSQIQVNRDNALPGTYIDFEKDLGLEGDQMRFFGDLMYRVSPVSSFRLTFIDISRERTKTVDRDIQFGDRLFSASSVLDISLSTRYYLLAYRYSFVRNSLAEFGASAGLNIVDVSSSLRLDTTLSGPGTSSSGARSKDARFIVPIPLVGIYFSTQVLPKTFLRNSILYIDGDIGAFSFKSLNYIITLDYSPWPNIALGAGAYSNRLQIDKGAGINGKFISMISSSLVYAKYFF